MSKRLDAIKAHKAEARTGIRSRSKTGMPLNKNGKVIISLVGDEEHIRRIQNLSVNGTPSDIKTNTPIGRRVNDFKRLLVQASTTFITRYTPKVSKKRVQSQFS